MITRQRCRLMPHAENGFAHSEFRELRYSVQMGEIINAKPGEYSDDFVFRGRGNNLGRKLSDRKEDRKDGALIRLSLGHDVAVMIFDDLFADGKPDTGSCIFRFAVKALEKLEDLF